MPVAVLFILINLLCDVSDIPILNFKNLFKIFKPGDC